MSGLGSYIVGLGKRIDTYRSVPNWRQVLLEEATRLRTHYTIDASRSDRFPLVRLGGSFGYPSWSAFWTAIQLRGVAVASPRTGVLGLGLGGGGGHHGHHHGGWWGPASNWGWGYPWPGYASPTVITVPDAAAQAQAVQALQTATQALVAAETPWYSKIPWWGWLAIAGGAYMVLKPKRARANRRRRNARSYPVSSIRVAHKGPFFARKTMKFFGSKADKAYQGPNGIFFVTYDRLLGGYSVRQYDPQDDDMTTKGRFRHREDARDEAKRLAG